MVYIELTTPTVFSFLKSECELVSSQVYLFVSTKLNKGIVAPCKVIQVILVYAIPVESGIHGFGIRNPANGIRNPTIIVIQNPGCWLWNPKSMDVASGIQDSLGLPNMGRALQYFFLSLSKGRAYLQPLCDKNL